MRCTDYILSTRNMININMIGVFQHVEWACHCYAPPTCLGAAM